jgi:hypothetical protein
VARVGALEFLVRTGFLVKGLLYIGIGALALQVALRTGGRFTGARGALATLASAPYGRAVLLLAGSGLLAYGVWRVLQGLLDPDRLGRGWRPLSTRAGYVIRGAFHGALGWYALTLSQGLARSSDHAERAAAVEALQWPFGDWLLVLVGVCLAGFAAVELFEALRGRFEPNLQIDQMKREVGAWAVGVCRFGVGARAVVMILLGWAVAGAGLARDPSEVGTTESSLRTIAQQPAGTGRWLLAITAAGLIAYGFYEILHARFLRIRHVK